MDESNAALYFPTGYVFGKRTVDQLNLEDKGMCPVTGKRIKTSEIKKVFFI